MKTCKCILRCLLSCILCAAIVCGMMVGVSVSADAVDKTYDIAVVYDNSGSMYWNRNTAWSQAKYAMEIFASMLDYQRGDRLTIFPMNDVVSVEDPEHFDNKNNPWTGDQRFMRNSTDKIEIKGKDDITKHISNMYTPYCGGTPDLQVHNAHDFLVSSAADEKWLIVLTDGDIENTSLGIDYGASELKGMLCSKASNGIKVQYIQFGSSGKVLESDVAKNFYAASAKDGEALQKEFLDISKRIFRRDELPSPYLDGNALNLDLSMKSVIAFVQGADAVIRSLKDASGADAHVTLNSGQRRYSTVSHGRQDGFEYNDIMWDDSLAGHVVYFSDCEKGRYTLDYTGASSIQLLYEPNVKLNIQLLNDDGEAVDARSGELDAGEYTIKTDIVDAKTGEDVMNHPLMGGDVVIKTVVTTADGNATEYQNGAKITLTPDTKTDIRVEATYLKKYTITSDDMADADLPWPKGGFVVPDKKFKLEAVVEQSDAWYTLSQSDSWKPVKVTMSYDGRPLTDEELKTVALTVSSSKAINVRTEMLRGQSAYALHVAQDPNGTYVAPETGDYVLTVDASFVDERGEPFSDSAKAEFEVQRFTKLVKILLIILPFVILFLLWLWFMTRKVLPKKIGKDDQSTEVKTLSAGRLDAGFVSNPGFQRKARKITVSTTGAVNYTEKCTVVLKLRPVDNRFTKSKYRRMQIVGIDSNCKFVTINGTEYGKIYNGVWGRTDIQLADGQQPPPIKQDVKDPIVEAVRYNDGSPEATLTVKLKNIK